MISIVIPVYNRKQFTHDCLRSLQNQTRRADQVIIVDDGSTDGTADMIRSEFPEVILLQEKGDLFWTASINIGIRHALNSGAQFILTMNNDTLASKNFVEKMLWGAEEKPDSLIGALDIHANTHMPYYGGEIFNWRSGSSKFLLDSLKKEDQRGLHPVSLFPGRGLLIPKCVFDKIGLFEEDQLPHYMADYDFTLRAKKSGFEVYCNYDAKLYTYPEEGGDHKIRRRKTLRSYYNHLFGIKGGGNLRNFTVYTFRNCPPEKIPFALFTGYLRRIAGFWLKYS
jgi:GT2 family glycosyltransferase